MDHNSRILDRLKINDLKARTFIGFNEWEREKKQEVLISITMHADLRAAGRSDSVEDTVDYKVVKNRILDLVENNGFLLIERMAEQIAGFCLKETRVERVDVMVEKVSALRFARSVSVEITRTRGDNR